MATLSPWTGPPRPDAFARARPWPRGSSGNWSAIAAWAASKFTRQRPIDRYFADFVREAGKLVVELDGAAHEGREDYDHQRTETLKRLGYRVLRFPNARVLADPGGTADDILAALRGARP